MTDIFDKQRDTAEVLPFNNEEYYGLKVRWGMKGIGFGELTFAVNKETGDPHVDKEAMGDDYCGRIMDILRVNGKLVTEAKFVDVTPGLAVPTTAVDEPKDE